MENEDKKAGIQPDNNDWVVYLPDKEMRAFERTLSKMEQARDELRKVRESMERVEN
jgi:hypothetical protein